MKKIAPLENKYMLDESNFPRYGRSMNKLILALLVSTTAQAATLTIKNETTGIVKIAELHDKCKGALITTPERLEPGKSLVFKSITPVVHGYTICAEGLCSSSAFGVRANQDYILHVTIKGIVTITPEPESWSDGNFQCNYPRSQ